MSSDLERQKRLREDRFFAAFNRDLPYANDVLKGHLLCEELLWEIVLSVCRDKDVVKDARLTFAQKLRLVQAIHGQALPIWSGLEKLNKVRNELAHGLATEKLDVRVDEFVAHAKKAYPATTDWSEERAHNLRLAIVVTNGYLSRIAFDYFTLEDVDSSTGEDDAR